MFDKSNGMDGCRATAPVEKHGIIMGEETKGFGRSRQTGRPKEREPGLVKKIWTKKNLSGTERQ